MRCLISLPPQETERMDSYDVNETENTCLLERRSRTWWIYLVTSIFVYLVGITLSSVAHTLKWLIEKRKARRNSNRDIRQSGNNAASTRGIRDFFRKLLLGNTLYSKVFITLNLVCNFIFIVFAIYRAYNPVDAEEQYTLVRQPQKITEMIVVGELILFAVVRFIASRNIVLYWIDPHTIVDVFTLPHIFVSAALGVDWIGLRSLRFLWLTQLISVLRFFPFISLDAIDIVSLMVYFLILWLVSSGMVHLFETQGDPWSNFNNATCRPFFLYAYMIMATVSTVGYGDVYPMTTTGRIFITFFIIIGLAFFAAMLPRLAEVTSGYYQRTQYTSFDTTRVPQHVIVCGHVTAVTAEDFLKDFLHPDRGDQNTHILFLHPGKPNSELKKVLGVYYTRVQYLDGSVLNSLDLQKAKIKETRAIFILANKNTSNPTEEDHINLFRLVSVKNTTIHVPIIIQLLHSFSKKQVYNIDGWDSFRDVAISITELKLGLLAQSCLCPGFSTLIANLFYTSDFPAQNVSLNDAESESSSWKELYVKGASKEIYSSIFSEAFYRTNFHQAARTCYNEFKLMLIAIERHQKLYVNPSSTTYPDLCIDQHTHGYFIAEDQTQVSVIEDYSPGNNRRSLIFRSSFKIGGRKSQIIEGTSVELIDIFVENKGHVSGPTKSSGGRGSIKTGTDDLICPENFDDSEEANTFHMYVSEPNRLETSILNPDMAFLESTLEQPNVDVKDHIIICVFADGNSPLLGLHSFLRPLRSKTLPPEAVKPVVIVSDKTYIEKEWAIIRNIPNIYVVVGSPLRWTNLKAAKIKECSVCVMLTVSSSSAARELGINDKEPVLCTLSIKNAKKLNRCNDGIQTITDLYQESNVQFLDFGDEDEPDERIYKAQPFACGEAFSASMFDSVTSSAYYSPGIVKLVERLIYSTGNTSLCCALPISGTTFCNKKFKDFFNSQLTNKNLCLGISRKLEGCESSQRFVITSPDPDMILMDTDFAFVIKG